VQHDEQHERLTVAEAAERMGLSEAAVRARIQRGSLASVRVGGRVFVDVPRDESPSSADRYTAGLEDRVRSLERRLDEAAARDAEQRRIIVALTSRIPALPSGQRHEGAAQEADTTGEGYDTPTTPGSGTGEPRAAWWRRIWR